MDSVSVHHAPDAIPQRAEVKMRAVAPKRIRLAMQPQSLSHRHLSIGRDDQKSLPLFNQPILYDKC
jgi:hypothetical protein